VNLDYIQTYLAIVKTGSFSEAARELSLSQPAVSFQIRRLEQELGISLIDRNQKTLTMTEAGKRLLKFAESIKKEHDILLYDLERLREGIEGDLVIGASTIPGEYLLPPLLGEFKMLHPAIKAEIIVSDSLRVINCVNDHTYEVGFCGIKPEEKDLDYFIIGQDEITLIVPPGHQFARREKISFMELQGEPLISRERTSGTQRSLEALLTEHGLSTSGLTYHLVLGTTQAIVSAVESGMGIAFISDLAIKKSIALGLVKQVEIDDLHLRRDFYCIYHKKHATTRLLEEFVSFVRIKTARKE
jgi:DNA-binding transcriptional LysR family regulator